MVDVTVFSTGPACQQCRATCRALDDRGLTYSIVDVTTTPAAAHYAASLGHLQAPVVIAGVQHWYGFRPDLIDALARIHASTAS